MRARAEVAKKLSIALTLLLAGVLFPLLMVLRIIPQSVSLSVLSYLCSVGGLFLGLYTLARYTPKRRD